MLSNAPEKREAKLYGGQAIIEGVMMKGAAKAVASVRAPDGEIVSKTLRDNPDPIGKDWRQVPFIRGIFVLVDSLSLGMSALRYSADVAVPEEEGKLHPVWESLMMIIPIGLAIGIFLILPTKIPEWIGMKEAGVSLPMTDPKAFFINIFEGGIRIVVFIVYILAISLMKDIRRVFQYHGAEHKTVNAYEAEIPLSVENVQKFSTAHYRCGTSFLFIVVIVHILLASLFGFHENLWIRTAVRLGTLIPVAAISYELLRLSAAKKNSFLCRLLFFPGLAFQKITALQPDDDMVEVAIHSFRQVVPEDDPSLVPTVNDSSLDARETNENMIATGTTPENPIEPDQNS